MLSPADSVVEVKWQWLMLAMIELPEMTFAKSLIASLRFNAARTRAESLISILIGSEPCGDVFFIDSF